GSEQGRQSGHEAALAQHQARLADLVSALSAASTELDVSRHRLQTEAVVEVLNLAITIARRVSHRQAAADPLVVTDNVAQAMKLAVRASDVRIAVHPAQRATLEDALPLLKLQWPALELVSLIDDATLAPSGCRIFTS